MATSKTYEGMFMVQSGIDFHSASEPVNTVLERSQAEVLSIQPWEERRLAYEVKGHKRGLYILTYFRMDPARLTDLHRDCELNEGVLRMMVLRRDKITDAEVNAKTPAVVSQQQAEEAAARQLATAEPPADAPPIEAAFEGKAAPATVADEAAPADAPPTEVPDPPPPVEPEAAPEPPAEVEAPAPVDIESPVEAEPPAEPPVEPPAEPPAEPVVESEVAPPPPDEAPVPIYTEPVAEPATEIGAAVEEDAEPKSPEEA